MIEHNHRPSFSPPPFGNLQFPTAGLYAAAPRRIAVSSVGRAHPPARSDSLVQTSVATNTNLRRNVHAFILIARRYEFERRCDLHWIPRQARLGVPPTRVGEVVLRTGQCQNHSRSE